jgi:polyketide cyclase/dehydrase/lipid transport protein
MRLLLALQAPALADTGDWAAEPAIAQRLAAGQVVIAATTATDPAYPSGSVRVAVRIRATPEAIWSVVTDCHQTPLLYPDLVGCRRVGGAPDGSWEDIEHRVRYSRLLPSVRYVFRAWYDRPRRIDVRRISGDLKEQRATWLLMPTADLSATVVEYQLFIEPGFWIPQALVTRSLRKDLPAAMVRLRDRVEEPQAGDHRVPSEP